MYKSLDKTSKLKKFNATLFYLTRTAVVTIIVARIDFGVQVALIQWIFVSQLVFLLEVQPYKDRQIGQQEFFNWLILLVKLVVQLPTSLWINEPENRYYFGFLFDCVIVVCYVANWLFLIYQLDLVFKLKKFYYKQR